MAKIPASKVVIRPAWLVDCEVCGQAVEPDSEGAIGGGFPSIRDAVRAKRDHLAEHEDDNAEGPR